ncbi:YfiR family protein [Zhongshania guokunii]|uniref:YfiR family protein n=1 Tax=Zhongshania guokunii TaxID=641783 RepID=A0ABV3U869_9GAMM
MTVMLPLFCTSIYAYADNSELEYRVKSAFLFNFTKFIEWPVAEIPRSEFVMCVAGNPQLHNKLIETVGTKQNNGKPIQFTIIKHPGEAQYCQMVFLGFPERERLGDWIGAMSDLAVLTVSDEQDFINLGGMIQFVIIDGKIRFDINQSAANRSSIKMSSKLLGLARNVN